MKLIRYGEPGRERPAVLVGPTTAVDTSEVATSFDEQFFSEGRIPELREFVHRQERAGHTIDLTGVRLGPPIGRPHQIVCIGLNYRDHARETGQAIPSEPIVFTKSPNTLVGPQDDVLIPPGSQKTDWEVELGIVIGKRTAYLDSPEQAQEAIAGYVLVNDVSEREYQLERGGQWCKGKSSPTFNPCGPWLVLAEEIDDPGGLDIWLELNGTRLQDSNTSEMVFGVREIVHYLSQFMTLEPGDLINTGTPAGVGMGLRPPRYARAGDRVRLGIHGLGEQSQTFASHVPSPR